MDIFSKIAAGEIPSYKCAESEKFYAFLDINPVVQAHTLVIPRREVEHIFDMEDGELAEFEVSPKPSAQPSPARRWPRWCSASKCPMPTSIFCPSTPRAMSISIATSS